MKNNKKGEMGIGTLIIFIAMILVAAIAASVLVTTATSLQNKALLTGTRSKGEVSTYINVLSLYAEDGSTSNNVEDLFMDIKLSAGSDQINFNEMLIANYLESSSASYSYGGEVTECNATSIQAGNYSVEYLIGGDNSDYLTTGDIARICFDSASAIGEDNFVGIKIVPSIGTPTILETVAPSIITTQKVFMYP